MQAPSEPLVAIEPLNESPAVPAAYEQYRNAIVSDAAKVAEVMWPNDAQLEAGVVNLRWLTAFEKLIDEQEENYRKPMNARLKEVRKFRDEFLAPLLAEKKRLTDLINDYQRASLKDQQQRARKALQDQREAEQAAAKAQAAIESAQDEDAKLTAQLALESAALKAEAASAALAVPTHTPRGLVTKTRYDFEILDWEKSACMNREIWKASKDNEEVKCDRAGLLKLLNSEEPNEWTERLPDVESSATYPVAGIRIFRDTRISTRS